MLISAFHLCQLDSSNFHLAGPVVGCFSEILVSTTTGIWSLPRKGPRVTTESFAIAVEAIVMSSVEVRPVDGLM